MRNSDDLVGKFLGTCTLLQLIGQGGMGAVYLAQQSRPARRVAVKVLLPHVAVGSAEYREFRARFQREADLVAQLEHVNIVPIYEYGEQDGVAFLVMPFLTGGSLRDLLTKRGALSLSETLLYIRASRRCPGLRPRAWRYSPGLETRQFSAPCGWKTGVGRLWHRSYHADR